MESKPNVETDDKLYERLKYAREAAQKVLDDRRDKAWRIFSWASSILLAVTAGVIAVLGEADYDYKLFLVLWLSIVVLAWYACAWIKQNQDRADNAGDIVQSYNKQLGIETGHRPQKVFFIGYVSTVVLLTIAASLAILFAAVRWGNDAHESEAGLNREAHNISQRLEDLTSEVAKLREVLSSSKPEGSTDIQTEAGETPNPAARADG